MCRCVFGVLCVIGYRTQIIGGFIAVTSGKRKRFAYKQRKRFKYRVGLFDLDCFLKCGEFHYISWEWVIAKMMKITYDFVSISWRSR